MLSLPFGLTLPYQIRFVVVLSNGYANFYTIVLGNNKIYIILFVSRGKVEC